MFFCQICREWCVDEQESQHHVLKRAVFGDGIAIRICRSPCHDALEELIRIKENDILRQHPEIYTESLEEISGNHDLIKRMIRSIDKRHKSRRYKKTRRHR